MHWLICPEQDPMHWLLTLLHWDIQPPYMEEHWD
jgi:hypothetical protein